MTAETPIYTPTESTLNDRSLVRSRKTLVGDMIRFKNRIKGFLHFYGIDMPEEYANSRKHWNRRFMVWLESIRENVKLLRSIPGIALITAMVILTEVEDINRFPNSERFSSFIGLISMTKSSGEKQKVGEITLIIESSWVAVRYDSTLLMAYQKLIKRMEHNNALIAKTDNL